MQDYDDLAAEYVAHRSVQPAVLERLVEGGDIGPHSRVIEVGCGTGNYIDAIAAATGCTAHGVDVSDHMLAQARARGTRVSFTKGTAECLDFPDTAFDFVFSVDAIHHLVSPRDHYREAYRVLTPDGRVCTATHSETMIRKSLVLTRYFPESVEANLARYPPIPLLRRRLRETGFRDIAEIEVAYPVEITDSALYANKANSTLHLIPQEAFERGIARLERDLAKGPIRGSRRYLLLWATK